MLPGHSLSTIPGDSLQRHPSAVQAVLAQPWLEVFSDMNMHCSHKTDHLWSSAMLSSRWWLGKEPYKDPVLETVANICIVPLHLFHHLGYEWWLGRTHSVIH